MPKQNNAFQKFKNFRHSGLKTCLLLLALLLYTTPARAAPLDATGAAHLKTIFTTMLQDQSTQAIAQGAKFTAAGPVLVEPAAGYYAVTLPRLDLVNQDGTRLELGMIAINATPDAAPGQWKMTVALPMPLTWFDAQGGKQVVVEIGRQNFAGIWREDLNAFTKFTAEYRNIKITAANDQFRATINTLIAAQDLQAGVAGRWSGPLRIDVDGVSVASRDNGTFALGHAGLVSHVDGYEFAGQGTGKIMQLARAFQGDATPQAQVLQTALQITGALADKISLEGAVRDVRISHNGQKISLPAGDASLALAGLRGENVNAKLAVHYQGLSAAPPEAATTPDHLALSLTADNLPYKNLAAIGADWLQATSQGPNMEAIARLRALISLPVTLEQAGARITVQSLDMGNALYQTKATGAAQSNAQAALGVTGKAHIEITGLENITGAVKSQLADPHTPAAQKPVLQKLTQTLTMVQMVGQQTPGGGARIYNLELTPQGQTLLNGTDINTLLPPSPTTP